MNKQDVQKWLDRYGAAWIKGDPEFATSLFSNAATYQETPFDKPMKGHVEIRKYWQEGASDSQENVKFASEVWAVEGDVAMAGWNASFTRSATGVGVELDGTFRLSFSEGPSGLICDSLQEWWHRRET